MTTANQKTAAPFDAARFIDFEHSGWQRNAEGWHQHFEAVSTQAVGALLDAVEIGPNQSQRGRRLLDVATGPGYAAGEAPRRGAEGFGVDFSSAQVELAQRQFTDARFQIGVPRTCL